jgi:rod shape-determining protein MreC
LQRERRFPKIWIWLAFICFALILLSSNANQRSSWNSAEQLVVEGASPIQNFFKQTVKLLVDLWEDYFYLVDVRQENRRLELALDSLRQENDRFKELAATHERLRDLLMFKEAVSRPAVAAQVVGLDPTGWFQSVVINKGRKAGIDLDMPVVNASGVVGRIVSVSPNYAKVLLVVDQNSAVDCLVQRSRDRGMVRGQSARVCRLDYMVKSGDVKEGDVVITSGLGKAFPKGLPVGTISNVKEGDGTLFKEIDVTPAVDFSKLEEVLVVLQAESDERNIDLGTPVQ